MTDCQVHAEELVAESAVSRLGGLKPAGEETQRPPGAVHELLEDCTCTGVAGVHLQTEMRTRYRVGEAGGVSQRRLHSIEGGIGVISPLHRAWFPAELLWQEHHERLQQRGRVRDEPMIERGHTDEAGDLVVSRRRWEVSDCGDTSSRRGDAGTRDVMTEEGQLRDAQDRLTPVDSETVLLEALEHEPEVLVVLLRGFARDQDVVDVGERR